MTIITVTERLTSSSDFKNFKRFLDQFENNQCFLSGATTSYQNWICDTSTYAPDRYLFSDHPSKAIKKHLYETGMIFPERFILIGIHWQTSDSYWIRGKSTATRVHRIPSPKNALVEDIRDSFLHNSYEFDEFLLHMQDMIR